MFYDLANLKLFVLNFRYFLLIYNVMNQLKRYQYLIIEQSLYIFGVCFEMDLQDMDEEQQEKLKNLWKIYGRQSKMGKQLYALYNKADKPKIEYPKVRPKTEKQIQAQKLKAVSTKKCPQKTVIQYPDMPSTNTGTKFYPIDFVPKRKAESVIRQEIQQYKRKRALLIPANRGVDRNLLVRKLQQKFNMKGGILPKGATLPGLENDIQFNEQQIKQKAKARVEKKYKKFSDTGKKQSQKQSLSPSDELDQLFEQIVQQIDDRQQYLDSIDHLDEPQMKSKIKKQMIERIAELQKIAELKNGK